MNRPKTPPKDLTVEAKKLWRRLYDSSSMDPAAEVLLHGLCQAWDRLQEARALILKDGLILIERTAAGDSKHRQNPACQVERDSLAALCRCWKLLGYDQAPPTGVI